MSYNGEKWIYNCLKSLEKNNVKNIILVDNNSIDSTIDIVENFFPGVLIIKSNINQGYACAINIALKKAIELNAKYVFILNQDIELEYNCMEYLYDAAKLKDGDYILSPVQMDISGKSVDPLFSKILGRSNVFITDAIFKNLSSSYIVDSLIGASLFFKMDLIGDIGLFDDTYFMYGEESDYLRRAIAANYKLCVILAARIRHNHSNIGKISENIITNNMLSEMIYTLKDPNVSFNYNLVKVCSYLFRLIVKTIFKGRFYDSFILFKNSFYIIKNIRIIKKNRRNDIYKISYKNKKQ